MKKKISVIIPFYNSAKYIEQVIKIPLIDKRVDEIIINDDRSDNLEFNSLLNQIKKLKRIKKINFDLRINNLNSKIFKLEKPHTLMTQIDISIQIKKIKIFRNKKNIGAFANKYSAISKSKNKWIYLIDCDNYLFENSISAIFNIKKWDKKICYCSNVQIRNTQSDWDISNNRRFFYINLNLKKIQNLFKLEDEYIRKFNVGLGMNSFLNNGNFFINKENYIKSLADPIKKKINPGSADVIAFSYYWLMSEYSFKVIPELYYFHRLRNDSYWHNDNKLSNIEKLNRKIDILKIKLKEILKKFLKKNNTYTDVATYHYHSAAVYYEGLIRNARNN